MPDFAGVYKEGTGVQREVMKRKRYLDLTGNLLNRPNDYLARIQAQVLDAVLKPWKQVRFRNSSDLSGLLHGSGKVVFSPEII